MRYKHLLISLALGIFFFILYYGNAKHLSPIVFDKIDQIYYADTGDYVGYFKHGEELDFELEPYQNSRHLLFRPFARTIFVIIKTIFPLEEDHAVMALLSLLASFNIVLAYNTLNSLNDEIKTSILFSVLYGISFSSMVFFSIPESYVSANMMTIIYIYFFGKYSDQNITLRNMVILSIIVGIGGLFSTALLSLLVINYYYCKCLDLKRFSKYILIGTSIAVTIFIVPHIVYDPNIALFYKSVNDPVNARASLYHFINYKAIINVGSNFLFYLIISPVDKLSMNISSRNLSGYFTLMRLPLIMFYCLCLFFTYKTIVKEKSEMMAAILLWLLVMTLFFVYFSPHEAMLWSVQIVFPLILLFHDAFCRIKLKNKHVIIMLFIIAVTINNLITLYST